MQSVFQPDDRRTARASAFRRHPAYETPRDRDRHAFALELEHDMDEFRAMRDRLACARILESAWPC